MLLGEIIFGGLGTGIYSIILTALIGLFLAGLMIGRNLSTWARDRHPGNETDIFTPSPDLAVLVLTALAVVTKAGMAGLTTNDGPHGFTEIIYAYASAFANNGQTLRPEREQRLYNVTTTLDDDGVLG
jgi:K+-transporting ATPase ATPase A chain